MNQILVNSLLLAAYFAVLIVIGWMCRKKAADVNGFVPRIIMARRFCALLIGIHRLVSYGCHHRQERQQCHQHHAQQILHVHNLLLK